MAKKQFQKLPKESTFYFCRRKRSKKQHKQEGEKITNSGTIQKQGKGQEGRPKTRIIERERTEVNATKIGTKQKERKKQWRKLKRSSLR